jgi:hypothetical protein
MLMARTRESPRPVPLSTSAGARAMSAPDPESARPAREGQATFGAQLRQYRLAAGLSQETLAERAGVSVQGLSVLENGKR